MKKKHLIFLISFFIIPFAKSENSLEFTGIKCANLFSKLYSNSPLKIAEKSIDVYDSLKLIVPSLGDLSKATEMSRTQKLEMEDNRKELIKLGVTEEVLKITRVERFEISGQVVDVFAYPNGDVQYITNFNKDKIEDKNGLEKPLLKVRNCKVEE